VGLTRLGPAVTLGLAGLAAAFLAVHSAGAQTASGEAMADSCSGCHGGGGGRGPGVVSSLEGRPAPALAAAMKAFRDGPQPGTVMGRIAKGFTDAEISELAAALAARASRPAGGRR